MNTPNSGASGAVAGDHAVKTTAHRVDAGDETQYWKDNYAKRPYADAKMTSDDYAPAYRYGWESFASQGGDAKTFESLEPDLRRGWDKAKGNSQLGWEQAKAAARDAWDRVANSGRQNTNRM